MIKKIPLVLYTGNHNKLVGITDYINYFKYLSAKHKFKLIITKKLSKKIKKIVIIEEFSNYFENIKLKKFFETSSSKKFLILTEFTDNKKKIYNSFQYSKMHRKINYFFIPVYISYLLYFHTKLFTVPRFHTGIIYKLKLLLNKKIFDVPRFHTGIIYKLRLLVFKKKSDFNTGIVDNLINNYLNKFFKRKINHKNRDRFSIMLRIRNLYGKYKSYIYFKSRYLFTKKYINFFDYILLSHQNIILPSNSNKNIKYSIINFSNFQKVKFPRKNLHYDFSGELNQYRREKLKEVYLLLLKKKNYKINFQNLKNYISLNKNIFIKSKKQKKKNYSFATYRKIKKMAFFKPNKIYK